MALNGPLNKESGDESHPGGQSDKVQALPEGMTSDSHGRIRIDGLPNGSYSWVLTHPAGASQNGSVVVAPQNVTQVTVFAE